jgi:hypothetical protein
METEQRRKSVWDQLAELPADMRQEKCLEVIGRLKMQRQAIERSVERWVEEARLHGATWRAVGEALGTTHQAASQRFGKAERSGPYAEPMESVPVETLEPAP